MRCRRCGNEFLPSTGCTRCEKLSDEELGEAARVSLAVRARHRATGLVLVGAGFCSLALAAVPVIFLGAPGIWLGALAVVAALAFGTLGARQLDFARLFHHLPARHGQPRAAQRTNGMPVARTRAGRAGPGAARRNRSQTLNDAFVATHEGHIPVDEARVRAMEPSLFVRAEGQEEALRQSWQLRIPEHLSLGDACAALCLSVDPLIVAAYSEDMDCVAIVELPGVLREVASFSVGQRMVTVNLYSSIAEGLAPDLIPGPHDSGVWGNFSPYIAEAFSSDEEAVKRRKESIPDAQWERLDAAVQRRHPIARVRDGRPTRAYLAASTA